MYVAALPARARRAVSNNPVPEMPANFTISPFDENAFPSGMHAAHAHPRWCHHEFSTILNQLNGVFVRLYEQRLRASCVSENRSPVRNPNLSARDVQAVQIVPTEEREKQKAPASYGEQSNYHGLFSVAAGTLYASDRAA